MSSKCQEMSDFDSSDIQRFFNSFDTVLTDCDGVLWKSNTPIEGSVEMIHKFRDMGKKVIYVTNNGTKSRKEYVVKCQALKFGGTFEDIFTTSYLVAAYLTDIGFKDKVYLYGSTGIAHELDDAGISHIGLGPDTVLNVWNGDVVQGIANSLDPDVKCVVASFDLHVSYIKMMKAITYLDNPDVKFVVTNTDERFPIGANCILPGTGSVVAPIIVGSGRKPTIMGKPSTFMFDVIRRTYPNIDPSRTLMIGDKATTDILLGKNCGLTTLLVGTGIDSLKSVRRWETSDDEKEKILVPDYFANSLGDLLPLAKAFV